MPARRKLSVSTQTLDDTECNGATIYLLRKTSVQLSFQRWEHVLDDRIVENFATLLVPTVPDIYETAVKRPKQCMSINADDVTQQPITTSTLPGSSAEVSGVDGW